MTLEKAINICQTEEITKMQMKEMNSEKKLVGISRNQKWKKAQEGKIGSDDRQKKENTKGSTQTMDGKKCKFCGRIHKPRECPAYGQECHKCKNKNHWASYCMTKKVHKASTKSDDDFVIGTVEAALKEKSTEALAILKINNKIYTAAEVNAMPMRVFKQIEDGHVEMERTKTSPWELMDPQTKNDSDKTQDICMHYVGHGYV